MATDRRFSGTGSMATDLGRYVSGFSVTETAGFPALVKIRDGFPTLDAMTVATGAAGNSTSGLHMFAITGVTKEGETGLSTLKEYTIAGSKIYTITAIPTFPRGYDIVGRRLYVTKAGAPATGVTPTTAQWFRGVADGSTTIASGSNGLRLPQSTIAVASGAALVATGGKVLITTSAGVQLVTYTAVDTNNLTGCSGGFGVMSTGAAVSQPMIPDNSTTTYSFNVADANFPATNPVAPTAETGGSLIEYVQLGAFETRDVTLSPNVQALQNGGVVYVEVNSGTVVWTVRGQ